MRFDVGKNKNSGFVVAPALIIVIILFLALFGGVVWMAAKKPFVIKQLIETDIGAVVKEVLPVSEYVCLVYNYQSINQRTYDVGNWLSSKKLLIVLDGTIKLGFDCRDIEVTETETRLILSMPPIKMLAHEQYPEKARSYDLVGGGVLPRQPTPSEILKLLGDSKREQERRVEENGELMRQARESAEALFKPLLELNPSLRGRYSVVFNWRDTADYRTDVKNFPSILSK